MSFLSRITAKLNPYEIEVICSNCGFPGKVKVPKGTTVKDFISEGSCKCENCGVIFSPKEYKTKWLK